LCVLCAVCCAERDSLCTAHSKCKLPDDGRRPKYVGAVSIEVLM